MLRLRPPGFASLSRRKLFAAPMGALTLAVAVAVATLIPGRPVRVATAPRSVPAR